MPSGPVCTSRRNTSSRFSCASALDAATSSRFFQRDPDEGRSQLVGSILHTTERVITEAKTRGDPGWRSGRARRRCACTGTQHGTGRARSRPRRRPRLRQCGHVRMFSPWEYNIDKAAERLLATGDGSPSGCGIGPAASWSRCISSRWRARAAQGSCPHQKPGNQRRPRRSSTRSRPRAARRRRSRVRYGSARDRSGCARPRHRCHRTWSRPIRRVPTEGA